MSLAKWTIAWLVCSVASLALVWKPDAAVDIDEIYWIGSAYYFHLAFIHPDWSSADWRLLPARENPPVAKYAIGLGLAAAGRDVSRIDLLSSFYVMFEGVRGAWGSGADYEKRAQVAARMSPEFRERRRLAGGTSGLDAGMLRAARRVMLVCGFLACACIFAFGAIAMHPAVGVVASQLFLWHPVIVESLNHAMSEGVALLFSAVAALLLLLLARRGGFGIAAGAGTAIGLACAAKMNSLIVLALAGIAIAAMGMRAWRARERRKILSSVWLGGIILLTALAVFILINPAILQDVGGGLIACFREHRITEDIQAQFARDHLTSHWDRFAAVIQIGFFHPVVWLAAFAAAVWCCRAKEIGARLAGWWWLVAFAAVVMWIPFPWNRYAAPLVPPSVLVVSWAGYWLAGRLRRLPAVAGPSHSPRVMAPRSARRR